MTMIALRRITAPLPSATAGALVVAVDRNARALPETRRKDRTAGKCITAP